MRGNPYPSPIMKLTAERIVLGQDNYAGYSPRATADQKAYVLGVQFGPMLLVVTNSMAEAVDEWDERHGTRVDLEADASTLADYGPDTESAVEAAMLQGDIRINDGGTMVWVDPHEWCREFGSIRDAADYFRN